MKHKKRRITARATPIGDPIEKDNLYAEFKNVNGKKYMLDQFIMVESGHKGKIIEISKDENGDLFCVIQWLYTIRELSDLFDFEEDEEMEEPYIFSNDTREVRAEDIVDLLDVDTDQHSISAEYFYNCVNDEVEYTVQFDTQPSEDYDSTEWEKMKDALPVPLKNEAFSKWFFDTLIRPGLDIGTSGNEKKREEIMDFVKKNEIHVDYEYLGMIEDFPAHVKMNKCWICGIIKHINKILYVDDSYCAYVGTQCLKRLFSVLALYNIVSKIDSLEKANKHRLVYEALCERVRFLYTHPQGTTVKDSYGNSKDIEEKELDEFLRYCE